MLYFLLKLMCVQIFILLYGIDNVLFTIRMQVFGLPDRLLSGFYMASVCFVYVCDVHHLDKRGLCMLLTGIRGDNGQGYPLPLLGQSDGQATPEQIFFIFPSKFFIFFQPYPITSSIYPFSLLLRGFLFLCVYFLTCVSFRVSEGKNTGE